MFAEYLGMLPQFNDDPKEIERQRIILENLERENNGKKPPKSPSEWQKGAASARDDIICSIIGMQNGLNSWEDPKQNAYQEVMNMIIEKYGDIFKPYKM